MIVMLNGSYGVGKTSIAEMLVKKLPNAMIYDPEIVGAALRELTEGVRRQEEATDDFRDIALWPQMVVQVGQALKNQYQKDLIVPMTIDNPEKLRFIQSGFRQFDQSVYHFCFTAPLDTVLRRIGSRSEGNGEWAIRKATECAKNFNGPEFEQYIDTSSNNVEGVTAEIMNGITVGNRPSIKISRNPI